MKNIKSIVGVLLVICMVFAIASCASKTNSQIIRDAFDKTRANGFAADVKVNGAAEEETMEVTMKVRSDKDLKTVFLEMTENGSGINMYLADDVAYIDMNLGIMAMKIKTDLKDAASMVGVDAAEDAPSVADLRALENDEAVNKEIDALLDKATVEDTADGKVYSFDFTADSFKTIIEKLKISENQLKSFKKGSAKSTVDKNGYVSKAIVTIESEAEGVTVPVTFDVTFKDLGKAPDLTAPSDLDQYKDASELSNMFGGGEDLTVGDDSMDFSDLSE